MEEKMKKAIIGKKLGMTQVFTATGAVVPVTVVEAGPCAVVDKKTESKEGYNSVVLAFGEAKEQRLNKADLGQYKKAGVTPKKVMKEFKLDGDFEIGSEIKCDIFAENDKVDVSGITRGRGFTGVIQRWNTHRLKMTHGTGPVHREVGSLSANSTPSRVFKNKKMAGQYGNEKVTVQNLEIVKVDPDRNILLIKGCVPGPRGSVIVVKEAVKGKRS